MDLYECRCFVLPQFRKSLISKIQTLIYLLSCVKMLSKLRFIFPILFHLFHLRYFYFSFIFEKKFKSEILFSDLMGKKRKIRSERPNHPTQSHPQNPNLTPSLPPSRGLAAATPTTIACRCRSHPPTTSRPSSSSNSGICLHFIPPNRANTLPDHLPHPINP